MYRMYVPVLLACVSAVFGRAAERRPVRVDDVVEQALIGDPRDLEGNESPGDNPPAFSPDGLRLAVIVRRGELATGLRRGELLVYEIAKLFSGSPPDVVARMASSSNVTPLGLVRWTADSQSLLFAAGQDDRPAQIFRADLSTHRLTQLTHSLSRILNYDLRGDTLVYSEVSPSLRYGNDPAAVQHGVTVATGNFGNLFNGNDWDLPNSHYLQLQQVDLKTLKAHPIPESKAVTMIGSLDDMALSLSGDGRFLLAFALDLRPPNLSKEDAGQWRMKGEGLYQYVLIDLESGAYHWLTPEPSLVRGSKAIWIKGGTKIALVGGPELPSGPPETKGGLLTSVPVVLEIDPVSLASSRIGGIEFDFRYLHKVTWDENGQTLQFAARRSDHTDQWLKCRTVAGAWSLTRSESAPVATGTAPGRPELSVSIRQSANERPVLVAKDRATAREKVILDPNPQLDQLQLARVETISWTATDGELWRGGLYYPPSYKPGQRLPLVIQTHGYRPDEFTMYGAYTSAMAAQPLAAEGMFVLQVADITTENGEAERGRLGIESAVAYLDSRALIDRTRMGIIAFSRTGIFVRRTLIFSTVHFAAAILAEAYDPGLLTYALFCAGVSGVAFDMEKVMGAAPYGSGLDLWRRESPAFNLDRIHTPIRLESYKISAVLSGWEWYAGLRRLGRPVELFLLPDNRHQLVRPWARQASMQGTVDWMKFWLKEEENSSPAKREQYERWHVMRTQQAATAGVTTWP